MNLLLPHPISLRDAIRWACVLEATAPKVGNVYPGKSFTDLCFFDFVQAAEIASDTLSDFTKPLSARMLACVQETLQKTGSNVNLGIVLLLGPLIEAAYQIGRQPGQQDVEKVLNGLNQEDGQTIFQMIRQASHRNAGASTQQNDAPPKSHDVQYQSDPIDLVEAMRMAADRDQIARQYASQFADFFDTVVPIVEQAISQCKDILSGIAKAHIKLLCHEPDSLIIRKRGLTVAVDVQRRAAKVQPNDPHSIATFDAFLRRDGNQLNPGTTADLIAAALFVLLVHHSQLFQSQTRS